MTGMMEKIKGWNRTVLELESGIAAFGLVCQAMGVWFVQDKGSYSLGLWIGIVIAMLCGLHMYVTLDRAFDGPEGDVSKRMTVANVTRYLVVVIVFMILALTRTGNPIVTFIGIMGLKVAAYMQPFTHKLTNKIFHETDPVPRALEDTEETCGEQEKSKE